MTRPPDIAAIAAAAARDGLAAAAVDLAPEAAWEGARGVVLLAADGARMWAAFRASPEGGGGGPRASDEGADPLDRWSARVVGALARRFGARAVGPSDGPPFAPFLAWAALAEPVWTSRLGMTLHARRGLWASWRGALLFSAPLGAAPAGRDAGPRPCDACAAPCLTSCPVGAFAAGGGYDAAACAAHASSPAGAECRGNGCLARRACPVGAAFAPGPEQAAFHMDAFLRSRGAR